MTNEILLFRVNDFAVYISGEAIVVVILCIFTFILVRGALKLTTKDLFWQQPQRKWHPIWRLDEKSYKRK